MSFGGGLFGSTNAGSGGSSLFGNAGAQAQQNKPAGGLFGAPASDASQNKPTFGLFGASTQQNQQQPQQTGGGLFGASQNQQQQQQPQQSTGGLFGAGLGQQQQQQQQPQQQTGGLFGSTLNQNANKPLGSSLFGASILKNQPQQQQPAPAQTAIAPLPKLGQSGIWQPNASQNLRERSIVEQMAVLYERWFPASQNCAFQYYFYNQVPPEQAPFYGPAADEDGRKWEDALSKKPNEGSIPVLGRGFESIAKRLELQILAVRVLQQRLHEIDASLTATQQKHELEFARRAAEARRKHVVLSARALSLATKVQVLRNRGYSLEPAEEELRRQLATLEKSAFDPVLSGRQDEIWARMAALRARTRLLKEEGERLGRRAEAGQEVALDEETLKAVKKLLGDYDAQLEHLRKEVKSINEDFNTWHASSAQAVNR